MTGSLKKNAKRRRMPYAKFKAWMTENGITQIYLGELLDKKTTTINQNLNGTGGDFSMDDIRKICQHYRLSSDNYFVNKKES